MDDDALTLSIYSRPDCHLCDELVEALTTWQAQYLFKVEIINIDDSASLTERYAARIPLLTCGENELSEYFLDTGRLQAFLESKAGKN